MPNDTRALTTPSSTAVPRMPKYSHTDARTSAACRTPTTRSEATS